MGTALYKLCSEKKSKTIIEVMEVDNLLVDYLEIIVNLKNFFSDEPKYKVQVRDADENNNVPSHLTKEYIQKVEDVNDADENNKVPLPHLTKKYIQKVEDDVKTNVNDESDKKDNLLLVHNIKKGFSKSDNKSPLLSIDNVNLIDQNKDKEENYKQIIQTANQCTLCELHKTRKNVVFSAGTIESPLVVIGEAPGADEDIQGFPFVGKAGKLLDKMLKAINLTRDNIYICNILKCRPPGNRSPMSLEVKACTPFLLAQLHTIKPKIILTLGNPATQFILNTKQGITTTRGKLYDVNGIAVLPSFHPAYLLRNPPAKKDSWEDLKLLRNFLDDLD